VRKRRKSKSVKKCYVVNIPFHSSYSFNNKHFGFNNFATVSQFLNYNRIIYRLVKHLDGPGEYKDEQYNCNMVFFSAYLPEKRKIVAYWDYQNEFLYY